ncbi:hypothetical protein GKZ89_12440 [Bacillus mangrovi]|uniref:Uncharacterized protein n=1 Tax=Metabacillus mangrovi TaxID=1491830 RepID=A0A7X2V5I1_9BACI|nr:hypothetical protein [Metabacillus mangrovi]MTH54211.1 hypothetical protein [Metabacillus mangrovi]
MTTLPAWVFIIYYLFLLITLGTALFRLIRRNGKAYSAIAFLAALTIPVIALLNSIGRLEGMNEGQHFISSLQAGALWAVYVLTAFFYLLVWWGLVFWKRKTKQVAVPQ